MRRYFNIVLYVIMLTVASCTHKELCYDHSHILEVDVVFDWCNAPDADPKSMSLYLFPEEGGRPIRHDLIGKEGGRIRLNIGTYHVICLNSDTETISITDDSSFETLKVSTDNVEALKGKYPPEKVWSDAAANIVLNTSARTVTLRPKLDVINCSVEIRKAENLKWTNNIYGSLSGMADGYLPHMRTLSEQCSTFLFNCRTDVANSMITGRLTAFGHCPSKTNTHTLSIYVTLADNSIRQYDFDVTEQVHNAKDPHNILIVLDRLPVPKPVVNGGGFQPVVDEWGKVEIDINM